MVRHLTLSERRLSEAELRGAESVRRRIKGKGHAHDEADAVGNTTSDGGVPKMDGDATRHQKTGCGSATDAALVGHKAAAGCSGSRRIDDNEEERCGTQVPPSPSGGVENHSQREAPSRSAACVRQGTNRVAGAATAGERQRHGDMATLQENRDPAGSLAVAFGVVASSANGDTASILREVEAARRQVTVAEQQAATFRVDAARIKAEGAKVSAEAEIGKERSMMESERLARELKATGIEVCHAEGAVIDSGLSIQRGYVALYA